MITIKEKQLIVDNVIKACSDISKLNKRSYNFLYLSSGFIAHYNINGFKSYYEYNSLQKDILINQRFNQYNNFKPDHIDYGYFMDKKDIYNSIVSKIHNEALNLMNT